MSMMLRHQIQPHHAHQSLYCFQTKRWFSVLDEMILEPCLSMKSCRAYNGPMVAFRLSLSCGVRTANASNRNKVLRGS